MPAVTPRRETPCRSAPLVVDRFDEPPMGARALAWLVGCGLFLVPWHLFFHRFAWTGRAVLIVVDFVWLVAAALVVETWRAQRRFGLGRVRLADHSFIAGGTLTAFVSGSKGLAGISRISVRLRCVDAVLEPRDTGRGTEDERVCYVVWEDDRTIDGQKVPPDGEARFSFQLPYENEISLKDRAKVRRLSAGRRKSQVPSALGRHVQWNPFCL